MPVQLTLRSPKGGRVLAERVYDDGLRIDATGGWLAVVDRNGSVIALHAATPGLEGAVVEYASAAFVANPDGVAAGEEPILATDDAPDSRWVTDSKDRHHFHDDTVPHEPVDLRDLDEDPRRPSLNAWPDDAVLLTYRELRRLCSLHVEACDPGRARGLLDGEVPLRVSEVLDR